MSSSAIVMMHNFGILADIVQALSIIMGVGLVMGGFFTLKRYGEMRTFMSHQMTLAWPLLKIVAGAMLLVLPVLIGTGLLAFFSTTSPLAYVNDGSGWDQFAQAVLMFVRVIGICSCIRGVVLFSRTGIVGGPPGTMGKALIHFVGGLMLVHIIGTGNLLKEIFDITT